MKHLERPDGLAPAVTAPPSLTRLDHRTKRRLVRGAIPIDERLDLHGYTEAAAHSLLRGFLITARARGARMVLVITGKGQGPGKDRGRGPDDRGVLRRAVPHWLADPTLRDVVLGYEEAHLAHGGAGAIYVRLRRPRGAKGDRE
ncbi:MAG: Smr/MutS family protein [Hyphomicrobiales bacterium]|nr:Smr/MutS family protein [Hyphomicrobiales bacterium]